jgi:hypothetical protein
MRNDSPEQALRRHKHNHRPPELNDATARSLPNICCLAGRSNLRADAHIVQFCT